MLTGAWPHLAVFDMMGTVVEDDGSVPACMKAAMTELDLPCPEEAIDRVRGASKREAFRLLVDEAGGDRDTLTGDAVYTAFLRHLTGRYTASPPRAVPGAPEALRWLRSRGVRVALNTGFNRAIVELLLRAMGWERDSVDCVVSGDDVARGRPAPDMIRLAMARTGVEDPARVMVVGDTALDLAAGQAAGAGWIVGVSSGAHPRARLEQAPHTHLLPSVAALPALLGEA